MVFLTHFVAIKVGNSNFTAITLSNFLTYIKDFYECDKLEGLPLSKAGQSSGLRSFWEEAFIPGEIMSTQAVGPAAISSITLQFMNETGWYSVSSLTLNHLSKTCFR